MIEVHEISKRLNDRAEAVCHMLLPGGKIVKDEYHCDNLNGGEGKSLKVTLSGHYAGKWRDWAGKDESGDLLDLWRMTRGLSTGDAVRQAKEFLGIYDTVKPAVAKVYRKAPEKALPAPREDGTAWEWLRDKRKLTRATVDAFKVKTQNAYETPNGKKPAALVFENYNQAGEVVNRSYRSIPRNPEEKKEVWQDYECAPCLFGWQAITQEVLKSKKILLCEGQIDAMTWHQWGIPALSIPNGSGMTWLDYEWDNLEYFDKIYLSFDSDKKGQEIMGKVIARLGPERCHIVKIEAKDANEALQQGFDAYRAETWIRNAEAPRISGLVTASDLLSRMTEELRPKPQPFTMGFFNIDWRKQQGFYFRPGEVTLWTGHSHAGKSTFLNFVMNAHLRTMHSEGIFIGSFEVKPETTLRRMITAFAGKGDGEIGEFELNDYLMVNGDRIVFADVVGFIAQDPLFEMMRFAFRRFGVTWFVIDSLMKVKGLEEDYTAQGDFINRLQEFAKSTGVHVNLVAHPRKGQGQAGKPGLLDIKGSSLIPNGVDNVVVVCRNQEKADAARDGELTDEQKQEYDTEIRIEKQKESGWLGSFQLHFDPQTFVFKAAPKTYGIKKQSQNGFTNERPPHISRNTRFNGAAYH